MEVLVIAFDAADGGHLAMGARVTHVELIPRLLEKVLAETQRIDLKMTEDDP